jgi:predicted Rossmann fold flavoprotein
MNGGGSEERRVVVVGAGAAGLTAAITAAEAGARVTLLNAHPRIGLKILMSGGTRCNVTHREVSERDFHGGSRPFVARVLRAFPAEKVRGWFASMGVELKLEETGKYFPVTNDAKTVLDALLAATKRAGVTIDSGARAVRLERLVPLPVTGQEEDDLERSTGEGMPEPPSDLPRFRIGIQTVKSAAVFENGAVSRWTGNRWELPAVEPDRWINADAVVISTGGLSFPRTGSDGTGYALVQALGHTIELTTPALTPLAADDTLCQAAQGITLDVELTLWTKGARHVSVTGSMVIAHFGYSGPAALDLSRHWHATTGERRVTCNFAPGETTDSMRDAWVDAARNAPERTVRRHLCRWVPERLAERFAMEVGVDPDLRVSQVDREHRAAVIARVVERDLHVTGTLGYEKAEVTAGGVKLSEVNPSTLESRIAPGLFLCGEILDVEGRLGGFNFQWAWSSGTVAGRGAGRIVS